MSGTAGCTVWCARARYRLADSQEAVVARLNAAAEASERLAVFGMHDGATVALNPDHVSAVTVGER